MDGSCSLLRRNAVWCLAGRQGQLGERNAGRASEGLWGNGGSPKSAAPASGGLPCSASWSGSEGRELYFFPLHPPIKPLGMIPTDSFSNSCANGPKIRILNLKPFILNNL